LLRELLRRTENVADDAPPAIAEAAVASTTGFPQDWDQAAPASDRQRSTSPQVRTLRPEHRPIGWAQHARPELFYSCEGSIKQVSTSKEAINTLAGGPFGKGPLLRQPDGVEVVKPVLDKAILDDRDPGGRT
jgi:hypothetical protein